MITFAQLEQLCQAADLQVTAHKSGNRYLTAFVLPENMTLACALFALGRASMCSEFADIQAADFTALLRSAHCVGGTKVCFGSVPFRHAETLERI